jgi:hypothetical protein
MMNRKSGLAAAPRAKLRCANRLEIARLTTPLPGLVGSGIVYICGNSL